MAKIKPEYEKTIDLIFKHVKKPFISISGKEVWDRESGFARILLRERINCGIESIIQSLMNVAHTNVTLNPIFKEAYFAERDSKCLLDFSYKGLIRIATSEGSIIAINANIVTYDDEFECEQGTNARIHFVSNTIDDLSKKQPVWDFVRCAFSIATFQNGYQDFIILQKWKLKKTWEETGANKNSINCLHIDEWIKKTAIRYHSKTLPHAQRLITAVSILNEHEDIKNKKPESQLLKRMKGEKKANRLSR